MINKGEVDKLLANLQELQGLTVGVGEKDIIPASFFGHAFGLAGKVIDNLREIEQYRLEQQERELEKKVACIDDVAARIKAEEEKIRELIPVKESFVQQTPPEPVLPVVEEKPVVEVRTEKPVAEPEPEAEAKPVIPKIEDKHSLSLKEVLEKKTLTDFRKSFSLNDRFLFRKELFGGDEVLMSKVIGELDDMHSLRDAMEYIRIELSWDFENKFVAEFVTRLEKRFT